MGSYERISFFGLGCMAVFLGAGCSSGRSVPVVSAPVAVPNRPVAVEPALPTSTKDAPPLSPATAPAAFDWALARNGEYDFGEEIGKLRLRDGAASVRRAGQRIDAALEPARAVADLDGDGVEDAVVAVRVSMGGTGSWAYVFTSLSRGGAVSTTLERNVFLDDRDIINAVRVTGPRRFAFDLTVHGQDDPACCPSQPVTRSYAFEGGHLVEADGS